MIDKIQSQDPDPQLDEILLRARIRNLLASPGVAGEVARDVNAKRSVARAVPVTALHAPEALVQMARLARRQPPVRMHKHTV